MVTTDQYAALSADVYHDSGAPDGWTRLQLDPPRTETAEDVKSNETVGIEYL